MSKPTYFILQRESNKTLIDKKSVGCLWESYKCIIKETSLNANSFLHVHIQWYISIFETNTRATILEFAVERVDKDLQKLKVFHQNRQVRLAIHF